jgi:hypothetical protein
VFAAPPTPCHLPHGTAKHRDEVLKKVSLSSAMTPISLWPRVVLEALRLSPLGQTLKITLCFQVFCSCLGSYLMLASTLPSRNTCLHAVAGARHRAWVKVSSDTCSARCSCLLIRPSTQSP